MPYQLLEIHGVSKHYPGVLALDDVSMEVKEGEVHGLVGANGAGKSTLIKILAGAIQPDKGDVYLKGEGILPLNPIKSKQLGIQVIHQDLNLVPSMNIAENVFLGNEIKRRFGAVNDREMIAKTKQLLNEFGLPIDPKTPVKELSVSFQQMVAVCASLIREARLIILDETTAMLTGEETQQLFNRIQLLKDRGLGFIYVSHQIEEVSRLCDRVTVLRDGKYIGTKVVKDTKKEEIISMIVGREFSKPDFQESVGQGDVVLEVKGLNSPGKFHDISFQLRSGQVLGFFGLVGAGRTEVVKSLFGLDPRQEGSVYLHGEPVHISTPSLAVKKGIGFLPEDRKGEGLLLGMSVAENITLPIVRLFSRVGFLNKELENSAVNRVVEQLGIVTTGNNQKVQNLSGGNQQKVIIAKWLVTNSDLIILDQPTRGIDVRAKVEIYKLIKEMIKDGHAVILISDEIDEIVQMSDQIIVMHEGRISGVVEKQNFSKEKILRLAYGDIEPEVTIE